MEFANIIGIEHKKRKLVRIFLSGIIITVSTILLIYAVISSKQTSMILLICLLLIMKIIDIASIVHRTGIGKTKNQYC